jgi:rRNA-processing protein FCF1
MALEYKQQRSPLRIILDSNALFVPLQFKIDLKEELKKILTTNFELILLSTNLSELKTLSKKGAPKIRKNAEYALKIAKELKILSLNEKYNRYSKDDVIFKIARKCKCPVFTNDRELRRRLRNINVPVIYVRQKSRLEVEGRI